MVDVEKLLLNIENLTEEEIKKLLGYIKQFTYINSTDEYMQMYNKLNENQLNILINLVGINNITEEFVNKLNNKNCLVVPFNKSFFDYYFLICSNIELANIVFKNPLFYQNIKSIYDINNFFDNDKLPDELKRILSNNAFKYIPNFIDIDDIRYNRDFIKYLSDDKLIYLIEVKKDTESILRFYEYLSDDAKRKIIKEEWFTNKIDINNYVVRSDILAVSPDDIIIGLLNNNESFLKTISLFEDSHKLIYLKLAINKYDEKELSDDFIIRKVFNNLIFISNNTFNNLGSEQIKLIDIINNMDSNMFIDYYFGMYLEHPNLSIEISNILFNRARTILLNEDILIGKLSSGLIKSNNREILDLVINNISKEDLLLLSIRNNYINECVLNILINNPNYFDDVNVIDINKYIMPKLENLDNFLKIFNFLKDDLKNIYFNPLYINGSDFINKYYCNKVKSDSNCLASIEDINRFNDEDIVNILSNIDIDCLMYLVLHRKININPSVINIVNNVMYKRINELAFYINNCDLNEFIVTDRYGSIFLLLSNNDKELLINSIDNVDFLVRYLDNCKNKNMRDLLYKRLINLYENIDINNFTLFPYFYDLDEKYDFYDKLSFEVMLLSSFNEFRVDTNSYRSLELKEYIYNKLNNDISVILDRNTVYYLDELIYNLDLEYQNKIKNYIDNLFDNINKYSEIKDSLNDYSSRANFILSVNNNDINDNNYSLVLNMFNGNRFLFNSMNFRLLNDDLLNMGNYFINKVSRYPIVSKKLLHIYDNDINKYNLIVKLSDKIIKENNNFMYDQKIEIIINYLYSNDIVFNNVDDNLLINIEAYILDQYINKNVVFKDLNINNYIELKNNLIDEKIKKTNNLKNVKDLIYQKYFGVNLFEIKKFMMSLMSNWDSVKDYCDIVFIDEYINLIKNIENINDIDVLKNISNNLHVYSISDFIAVKGIMVNAYNKSIEEDIKGKQEGTNTTLLVNDKSINVVELIDNFGVFVHSTDAYGSMVLINNDYYDSWNYNPNTKNHGICTSYITNSSYGTALIKDNGVMFGFASINKNSVPLMAPYDLVTQNDGFTINSYHTPLYARLNDISNSTRHTHNEFSLERIIYTNDNSYLRQPDCIIIFEDMSDRVKENSIKAYNDFKAHGIDLNIIYIDRVKVAKNEARKLNYMMSVYNVNYDLSLLKEIISKYESNICGCDVIGNKRKHSLNLIDQDELFNTSYLVDLLYNTLDYIENNKEMLDRFISILEEEQYKFDLIEDFNKNREHSFKIYDEKLKQKIKFIKNNLNNLIKK